MKQYNISAWLGETIPLQIQWDTPITADAILMVYNSTSQVFSKTVSFVDQVATLDMTAAENTSIGAGEYTWLVKIVYPNGDINIIPDTSAKCASTGNCDKPGLYICEVIS